MDSTTIEEIERAERESRERERRERERREKEEENLQKMIQFDHKHQTLNLEELSSNKRDSTTIEEIERAERESREREKEREKEEKKKKKTFKRWFASLTANIKLWIWEELSSNKMDSTTIEEIRLNISLIAVMFGDWRCLSFFFWEMKEIKKWKSNFIELKIVFKLNFTLNSKKNSKIELNKKIKVK